MKKGICLLLTIISGITCGILNIEFGIRDVMLYWVIGVFTGSIATAILD